MTGRCTEIRENILRISHASGHGHVPTCFSVVEILVALYSHMRHRPGDPNWPERDLFLLSKGHASLAHYCTLASFGYFDPERVYSFGGFGSAFGCHADRLKVPGIEASTGSLGHGIGIAAGIALALRLKKSPQKVYVLVGDGESNEGTVWESVMVAVSRGLSNLTIIYDDNRSHGRGLQITNPAGMLESFGCSVREVDGHDLRALGRVLSDDGPEVKAVVAKTLKGHGCPMLSKDPYAWHRRSPQPDELQLLLEELYAQAV